MRRLIALGMLAALAAGCKESPTEQPWGEATVPSLAIGQVFAVPQRTTAIRVEGGAGGAEYTLVPVAATASGSVTLTISATGVQAAAGPPNPFLGAALSSQGASQEALLATPYKHDFERRLRQRERELTRLVGPGPVDGAPLLQTNQNLTSVVPTPGQLLQFNTNLAENCANPVNRTGRVVAVSQRAIVVADTENPTGPGTFTDDEYRAFAEAFDQRVWPTTVQNFGEPTDIDGNQRVIIFFTRAVNELTPRGQSWFVGGVFYSRDLFPRTTTQGLQACAASNAAEIFYMLVPDPAGVVNGNPRTKANELRNTVTVIAHEFQHLINASRRLYIVQARSNWNEEIWLNEGLSHIAEELLVYQASSLTPRQNIDGNRLANSQSEQTAFFDHQYSNITRLARYLQDPDTTSMLATEASLAMRGAVWLFLRYAADRRVGAGGSESAFWRGLVDADAVGLNNLRNSLGTEPMDWINDWLVSVYTDDAVPGLDPRFTQPSWNLRSLYPALVGPGNAPIYGTYPLKTRSLAGTTQSLTLRGGTAAFLRFAVAPGGSAEIAVQSSGGATPDSNIRFNIVRTR